jgi:hypothetical protein
LPWSMWAMIEKLRMWFIEAVIASRPAPARAGDATDAGGLELSCRCVRSMALCAPREPRVSNALGTKKKARPNG